MIRMLAVSPDSVPDVPFADESIPQLFVIPEFTRNIRRAA
jgi:hypothetical protein